MSNSVAQNKSNTLTALKTELHMKQSRRDFVKTSAASVLCTSALFKSNRAYAQSLKLPLGLQLYSVRELLPKDYAGTLKDLASLGYLEVEAAGYYNHSAAEVKQAIDNAGLKLVSAHYASDPLHEKFDEILAFHHELGVTHLICSWPGKNPAHLKKSAPSEKKNEFTLDDWKWNADQFNKFGEKMKAAGITFGYHNHSMEFHAIDGVVPLVELMRLTDPDKVSLELDCGWVIVGGADPVEYLRKYAKRINMLHIKDFDMREKSANGEPKITELGQGTIDNHPILEQAAKNGTVTHCFVEQEAFTVPPMQSLKIDADYMHKLGAA
jgi:sugar phosphate isomerase/epimerase